MKKGRPESEQVCLERSYVRAKQGAYTLVLYD